MFEGTYSVTRCGLLEGGGRPLDLATIMFKFILKKHYCAFLHPPRKAKASKEGKRKKGADLKRSSMEKNAGGAPNYLPQILAITP